MDFSKFELTEEKVKKLRPIFEKSLSRKYGRKIEIAILTMGNITIRKEPHSNEQFFLFSYSFLRLWLFSQGNHI